MAKQKTARANVREPEVIDVEPHPDQALVATDGATIVSFIRNIVEFFRTAQDLEAKAGIRLREAKALAKPTTAAEDEGIQRFIKATTAEKKAIEAHWSICQTFSQVHRKLTAGRGRAVTLADDAAAIAQTLHNDYAEAERRRAREEQDRKRQEAEAQARADRERELAEAEQKALDLELASENLSERERRFVDYVTGPYPDPARAAQQAGYKDKYIGLRLMGMDKIKRAIDAIAEAKRIRDQAAALKDRPLDVRTETVRPNVTRASGAVDRTTHSAEILDEARLIAACIDGGYGIPRDILQVNPAKVNEYARSLQERINLWPGVRHVKNTKTV